MFYKLLEDITIIDFTQRLPGPFATFILQSLGAKIIKVENADHGGDFFQRELTKVHTPNLNDWYKNINEQKTIRSLSFSNEMELIIKEVKNAHLILAPKNSYFENFFLHLKLEKNQSLLYLSGGKEQWKNLHDLNALSFTETFKDHLYETNCLPYLPIAGITYGQYLATLSLAMMRKAEKSQTPQQEVLYLKDVCSFLLDALHSKLTHTPHKFLHNGLYPCYQIYTTKDGAYVCLAAIEEKYWNNFLKEFNLPSTSEDRFDKSPKTYELLKKLFANITSHEIQQKIINKSLCLTITKA